MPSQNMLPKGQRRRSVKKEYRELRTQIQEREAALRAEGKPEEEAVERLFHTADFTLHQSPYANVSSLVTSGPSGGKHPQEEMSQPRYGAPSLVPAPVEIQSLEELEAEAGIRSFTAEDNAKNMRLDAYLAKALPDISRGRVQILIDAGQVMVDGKPGKGKARLKGGELIEIEGKPQPEPLRAEPEDIPLDIVYEDDDLAVINKASGMTVHAGAGSAENNRGTLVNALLFHFGKTLSTTGGDLRPGIVHRLDKETSGLIVVAKNDSTHRKLGDMFSERRLRKVYLALVHGKVLKEEGTIDLAISRDVVRRNRMTTRRAGGRNAVSHYKVLERLDTPYGPFTLVQVHIETGRTHQIRVHMQAIGHAVVGDTTYGAPHHIPRKATAHVEPASLTPERNFLHAAELEFLHPRTGATIALRTELPAELMAFLEQLQPAS